ncbi:MAG: glycosyltransferase [Lachnospiraceae bacterium]|nr:glycosyltransferase [Lachnospiraceae bacterium]
MKVEAVIPAYKPDEKLIKAVRALNSQTMKPEKVRIILTKSREGEKDELLARLPEGTIVEEIEKQYFSHGGTRQYAVDSGEAAYILFMTQDAIPADRYLVRNLYGALMKKDAAVAYARQIPFGSSSDIEKYSRRYNYPSYSMSKTKADLPNMGIKTYFCSDACAMYNVAIHNELGGFDVTANFNEDMLYACKAVNCGCSIEYVSDAHVYHSHDFTLKEQFRRYRHVARSQKQHREEFRGVKSESEGIKYLLKGMRYFIYRCNFKAAFGLIATSAVKYLGFLAGKIGNEQD